MSNTCLGSISIEINSKKRLNPIKKLKLNKIPAKFNMENSKRGFNPMQHGFSISKIGFYSTLDKLSE